MSQHVESVKEVLLKVACVLESLRLFPRVPPQERVMTWTAISLRVCQIYKQGFKKQDGWLQLPLFQVWSAVDRQMDAHQPEILQAELFPLLDRLHEGDREKWRAEVENRLAELYRLIKEMKEMGLIDFREEPVS
jgi:hypothetical protein